MLPLYRNNDYLLVSTWPINWLERGDNILVRHHQYGDVVKTIQEKFPSGCCTLYGRSDQSINTQQMGIISPAQIIGKVIWHIPSEQ